MTRDDLADASRELQQSAIAVDDADLEERIYAQSQQYAKLAEAASGPDHGRLARHENALHELIDETDGDVSDHLTRALQHAQSYRETVDGV